MAIADQLDRLNVLRQNLAAALTAKSVEAAETEGFETLVPKVSEIEGAAHVQRYEGTFTRNVSDRYEETVVDIGFQPDAVILLLEIPDGEKTRRADLPIIFDAHVSPGSSGWYWGMCWEYYVQNGVEVDGDDYIGAVQAFPTSTGFKVARMMHYSMNWNREYYNSVDCKFVAIKYT